MGNSYKPQSLARRRFNGLPGPAGPGERHVGSFSVARVRPRTSKGITDLLLLNLAWLNATCPSKKLARSGAHHRRTSAEARAGQATESATRCRAGPPHTQPRRRPEQRDAGEGYVVNRELFNRLESRSLSELTRQIAPPTKNGHAPPPTESRKSSQSVNPYGVRAG